MKTLLINKKKFCDWYFDEDMIADMGDRLISELINEGRTEIDLQECLDFTGYIPTNIVINKKDIDKESKKDCEIQEPSDHYNLKLVRK